MQTGKQEGKEMKKDQEDRRLVKAGGCEAEENKQTKLIGTWRLEKMKKRRLEKTEKKPEKEKGKKGDQEVIKRLESWRRWVWA